MAKISAYPDGGAIQSTDKFVIARSGQNFSVPASSVRTILTQVLVLTSSTDFVKANYSGLYAIRVRIVGGGGGGGGVEGNATGAAVAGSGGGGEYREKFILASSLSASETVTIGAGGSGGAAGNNNGSAGGTTSFGSHFSAVGGNGGTGQANQTSFPAAGAPGAYFSGAGTGTSDLTIVGGEATWGLVVSATSTIPSLAGASALSANRFVGTTSASDADGAAGRDYGGGGTGARSSSNSTSRAGGAGAGGVCIIEIYSGI